MQTIATLLSIKPQTHAGWLHRPAAYVLRQALCLVYFYFIFSFKNYLFERERLNLHGHGSHVPRVSLTCFATALPPDIGVLMAADGGWKEDSAEEEPGEEGIERNGSRSCGRGWPGIPRAVLSRGGS